MTKSRTSCRRENVLCFETNNRKKERERSKKKECGKERKKERKKERMRERRKERKKEKEGERECEKIIRKPIIKASPIKINTVRTKCSLINMLTSALCVQLMKKV